MLPSLSQQQVPQSKMCTRSCSTIVSPVVSLLSPQFSKEFKFKFGLTEDRSLSTNKRRSVINLVTTNNDGSSSKLPIPVSLASPTDQIQNPIPSHSSLSNLHRSHSDDYWLPIQDCRRSKRVSMYARPSITELIPQINFHYYHTLSNQYLLLENMTQFAKSILNSMKKFKNVIEIFNKKKI